jgi:hypothetical protein
MLTSPLALRQEPLARRVQAPTSGWRLKYDAGGGTNGGAGGPHYRGDGSTDTKGAALPAQA